MLYLAAPSLCPWTSSTSPSLPFTFRTTSILSRPDPSSVCLGWIRCCTPLPALCARGHQVLRRRCPTRSAQPPSRAELTRRLPVLVGSVVVPCYPLSVPLDIKYFAVVAPPTLHNFHLSLSRLDPLLYPSTPSLCPWIVSTSSSLPTRSAQSSSRAELTRRRSVLLPQPFAHNPQLDRCCAGPQATRSPTLKPFAHRPSSPSPTPKLFASLPSSSWLADSQVPYSPASFAMGRLLCRRHPL